MNTFKHSMKIIALALFATFMSCDDKRYPDLEDGLYAEIVTSMDTIVAKLYYKKAPVTVANFMALAQGNHPMVDSTFKGKKFYNGLIFHRVMNNFMIQGGDPQGTGTGGPGYKFGDEFDETLRHDKPGILSMANGGPNLNGSQFFITEKETPWLDGLDADGNLKDCANPRIGCHSVFGEVVLGMNVQDSISNVKVGPGNRPEKDVFILDINIIAKGYDARNFDAVKTWNTELPKLDEKAKLKAEEASKKAEDAKKEAESKINAAANITLPILDDYKSKAKTLASGLMIHTITKGNGPKPKLGQFAMVYYEGYFTDGKLLDTNRKDVAENYGMFNPQRDQQGGYNTTPMQVSPDAQMVAGFKEGLAEMSVGDKAYLYLPSHLGWGAQGRPPVKPNTDVIFIIEMVEIQK